MKKLLCLLLSVLLLVALTACGGDNDNSGSSAAPNDGGNEAAGGGEDGGDAQDNLSTAGANGSLKIGFTAMNLTSEFHIAAANRIEELCKERGYEFTSVDGNGDNQRQINAIEDMITAGIDVLILCPVSQDGILPALIACEQNDVIVIGYDSKAADDEYLLSYVASDNYSAGYVTGRYLVDNFPEGGTVGIINNPQAESVVARVSGFVDALEGSGFEVVADDNIQTAADVLQIVEDTLQRFPELDFYWALNDDCALIAQGAIQTAGAPTQVIGVDGTPSGKEAILNGTYLATAAQSPITIAETVFEVMETHLAGGSVEEEYLIDCFIIDAANVAEYGTDTWQ